jgi:hypothetical protein
MISGAMVTPRAVGAGGPDTSGRIVGTSGAANVGVLTGCALIDAVLVAEVLAGAESTGGILDGGGLAGGGLADGALAGGVST